VNDERKELAVREILKAIDSAIRSAQVEGSRYIVITFRYESPLLEIRVTFDIETGDLTIFDSETGMEKTSRHPLLK
jgi:hypothetical protein